MGVHKVRALEGAEDRAEFLHRLVQDVQALEYMLEREMFETTPIRIGAEQEVFLVDGEYMPDPRALELLAELDDAHFTTEIGKYNLEINLDPIEVGKDCLRKVREQLEILIRQAQQGATAMGSKILLTGILPTLTQAHTRSEFLTPVERYAILNKAARNARGSDFQIHIQGLDEVTIMHESVLLEACNTSFQIHLQTTAAEFVGMLNWANAISGPMLATCVNSPLLFGKELWQETRLALFSQSVDVRASSHLLNDSQARVSFDHAWHTGSVADVFKDQIARFKAILTAELGTNSLDLLEEGQIPKLRALCLHNGTVYRWNRPCFGVGEGKPHLRIECRYIPSGPTVLDEVANLAFWLGLMKGMPAAMGHIHEQMDFKDVKTNFLAAARYGLNAPLKWKGGVWTARELVSQVMLPMAKEGLSRIGVDSKDVDFYLGVIQKRIESHNGAEWTTKCYRNLLKTKKRQEATQLLTELMISNQEKGDPIADWEVPLGAKDSVGFLRVRHVMNTDIFTLDENDSIEMAVQIMRWKNIHHLPIIKGDRRLVGIISSKDLETILNSPDRIAEPIKFIMKRVLVSIEEDKSLEDAKKIMSEYRVHSLPVVDDGKLIGIITSNDL
jgi:CBS domain-containing protein